MCFSILSVNAFDFLHDDDNYTRQQQVNLYAFLYILHALFTTAGSYFRAAVFRNVLIYILAIPLLIYRNSKGDSVNLLVGIVVTVCSVTTIEFSLYNNYKAKLRLYLQVKQMR